ncbi:hypothetical protein B0E45_32210 [Sinorhizobium sp. A49]|nr:hypothetical protein B0E45_32210 [Sinorhizobium sp. A49]
MRSCVQLPISAGDPQKTTATPLSGKPAQVGAWKMIGRNRQNAHEALDVLNTLHETPSYF